MMLTKEAILAGKDLVYEIDILEPKGTAKLRPLTAMEYNLVQKKKVTGMNQKLSRHDVVAGIMNMDYVKTTENEFAGDALAISMSLIEPVLTEEEVKGLKQATFNQLAVEVARISGDTKKAKEMIAAFRPDDRGAGDLDTA